MNFKMSVDDGFVYENVFHPRWTHCQVDMVCVNSIPSWKMKAWVFSSSLSLKPHRLQNNNDHSLSKIKQKCELREKLEAYTKPYPWFRWIFIQYILCTKLENVISALAAGKYITSCHGVSMGDIGIWSNWARNSPSSPMYTTDYHLCTI